jgi:hypothetical protein
MFSYFVLDLGTKPRCDGDPYTIKCYEYISIHDVTSRNITSYVSIISLLSMI